MSDTTISTSTATSGDVDRVPASPSAGHPGAPGPQPGAPLLVLTIQFPGHTPDALTDELREFADYLMRRRGVDDVILELVRVCHVCGCTDDQACFGGCWWVNAAGDPDLCSACASAGAGGGR